MPVSAVALAAPDLVPERWWVVSPARSEDRLLATAPVAVASTLEMDEARLPASEVMLAAADVRPETRDDRSETCDEMSEARAPVSVCACADRSPAIEDAAEDAPSAALFSADETPLSADATTLDAVCRAPPASAESSVKVASPKSWAWRGRFSGMSAGWRRVARLGTYCDSGREGEKD